MDRKDFTVFKNTIYGLGAIIFKGMCINFDKKENSLQILLSDICQ